VAINTLKKTERLKPFYAMFTISYVYLKEYESLSTLLLNLINFVPSLRPLFGHNLRPNGLITVMFLSFRLTYNETPLCYTAELWQ